MSGGLFDGPLPVTTKMVRYRDPQLFDNPLPIVIVDEDGSSNSGAVTSVAGRQGDVVLTKSDVGLDNVSNTTDADKPVSTAVQTELSKKANAATLATKADLVGGVIPTAQIPALAINTVVKVNSQAEMLALTSAQVQPGDVAVDLSTGTTRGSYMLGDTDPSVLSNWVLLNAPTDAVNSVNGQIGTIVLSKSDIGLSNVNNTSDASKPVSTAQQTALNAKADKLAANNVQTGTTYTLAATDSGGAVETNNAQPVVVTVPPNSAVAMPIGTVIEVTQIGAGQLSIAAGAGVTILSRGNAMKLAGQYAASVLRKRNTDEWLLTGDLTS